MSAFRSSAAQFRNHPRPGARTHVKLVGCCRGWRGERCLRGLQRLGRLHKARSWSATRDELVPVAVELCMSLGLARGLSRGCGPLPDVGLSAAELLKRLCPRAPRKLGCGGL